MKLRKFYYLREPKILSCIMKFFRKNLIDITIFILLQYFFTSLILMYLYTGGNPVNHDMIEYVWNLNYLSDLGSVFYFNGNKNPFGIFYDVSIGLIGIGTAIYFYLVSSLIEKYKIRKWIIFLGVLSGIGYLLIGFYPVDLYLKQHIRAGMLAFYSFFLAELLLVIFVNRANFPFVFYATLILILFFVGRILLIYFIKDLGWEAGELLNFKTISQKIVVYGQIIVAIMILSSLKKRALYSGQ